MQNRRRVRVAFAFLLAIAALALCGAAAALALQGHVPLLQSGRDSRVHPADRPVTFQVRPVPADVVPSTDAVDAARQYFGLARGTSLPADIVVTARFGDYSDTIFTDRLVWVVTLSGPGVGLVGSGPRPPPGATPRPIQVAHSETVIIDAKSGQELESRSAPGL